MDVLSYVKLRIQQWKIERSLYSTPRMSDPCNEDNEAATNYSIEHCEMDQDEIAVINIHQCITRVLWLNRLTHNSVSN